jgi:hypothetical protein
MPKDHSDHAVVRDEKGQEQPKDKKRARKDPQTKEHQTTDDELQPLREKSGF